jgi:tetratricopeptide (TPR) repeat protein
MPVVLKRHVEDRRLDSWKEIATFFGRNERTVKRWEKNRALPIHRVPGSQRGLVFAYSEELTRWLNSSALVDEITDPPLNSPDFIERGVSESEKEATLSTAIPPVASQSVATTDARKWKALGVACLLALTALTALFVQHRRAHAITSAPASAANALHKKTITSQQAVDLYLKGRYYWNQRTGDSLQRAVDSFNWAIAIDPTYAQAYAGLADTYDLLREYTSMPESEAYPLAIAAATKAVVLDDSLPEAHRALAFGLFFWKWEIPRALEEYQKAIQLDPNDADAHHWYATSLLTIGRYREALAEIERARALYPASPSILADRALILYWSGDHTGGIAALKEIEQAEPRFLSPPRYLASLYFEEGAYPLFLAQSKQAALISKDISENSLAEAARRGWQTGGERGMLEALESAQLQTFENGKSSGFQLAHTCLLLKRRKDAIRYLEAAYSAHDSNILTLPHSRFNVELSGDPDFERLEQRVEVLTKTEN